MNDKQAIVSVSDQFALKNQSDEVLKRILPAYKTAIRDITRQLESLPEGKLYREFWLKSQLKTIEQQFQQVSNRIYEVLPEGMADDFFRAIDNAEKYLEAGGISPGTGAAQGQLTGATVGGETVSQGFSFPDFADNQGFMRPTITRSQIAAVAREGGFKSFTPDILAGWQKSQAGIIENTLRTGFLLGQTNEQIMREFGPLGPGRKGWAMTQTVVRTAMSEASAEAHDAFWEANEELLPAVEDGYRWEWNALNDTKLCSLCAPLHGMKYKQKKDAPKRYPDRPHWGCRCDVLPITATEEQMRKDGDLPAGSFLERKEVTYTNGKRDPAPAGWRPVKEGGTAYSRPQKQGVHKSGPRKGKPQMYWVRRVDMPKGKTSPGDMLKRANRSSREAVLGSKKMADKWDEMIKQPRYANDPQELVRKLLGNDDMGGGPRRPPQPPKPYGGAPKPRGGGPSSSSPKPRTPKPTPKPAAPTQASARNYVETHQWDNGKNKLSHKAIADSLEIAAKEPGLSGAHMRQMMEFQQKKKVQTMWSNGREKAFNAKGDDFAHWKNKDVIDALRANPGNDNELEFALAADLEKGKNHPFMQKIGRVSSGAAGHTIDGGNLIVLKQEAQYQALTKSSVANVRAAIKRSVEASQSGQPVQITIRDLYSKTGKTTWKTKEGWIGTYVHEMGHQVHFRAGKPAFNKYLPADLLKRAAGNNAAALEALGEIRKLRWTPSKYGTTNEMERFAETFTQYVFAPDELKKASPAAYKWVEDALKEAMK